MFVSSNIWAAILISADFLLLAPSSAYLHARIHFADGRFLWAMVQIRASNSGRRVGSADWFYAKDVGDIQETIITFLSLLCIQSHAAPTYLIAAAPWIPSTCCQSRNINVIYYVFTSDKFTQVHKKKYSVLGTPSYSYVFWVWIRIWHQNRIIPGKFSI